MLMTKRLIALCVGYLLFIAVSAVTVKGELVVERSPCPGETALYSCTVSGGDLEWRWTPLGRQPVDYVVVSLLQLQAKIRTLRIGGTEVIFNVTEFSPSTITSVALVNNPEILNGTTMTCGGQTHMISVPGKNLVPLALRVSRVPDNDSEVNIQPVDEWESGSISYQLSSSDTVMPWTSSIILSVADDLTFFHCQYNGTFSIDSCIFDDSNTDANFTLYRNGTWLVSRVCKTPEIQVTCEDGSWSEDIMCLESINHNTDRELNEVESTGNIEFVTSLSSEQCPMSGSKRINNLDIIIGSVMGSFVLALILGIVLGLLCGVKFARVHINKEFVESSKPSKNNINVKTQLYEEVAADKSIELTENVSYDIVKKH